MNPTISLEQNDNKRKHDENQGQDDVARSKKKVASQLPADTTEIATDRNRNSEKKTFKWNDWFTASTKSLELVSGEEDNSFSRYIKENELNTLWELKAKLKGDEWDEFTLAVTREFGLEDCIDLKKKLKTIEDDLDSALNGKILKKDPTEPPSHAVQYSFFIEDLQRISVMRKGTNDRDESPQPVIVSGSSGAGKTTFAALILPNHLFRQDANMFCVVLQRHSTLPSQADLQDTHDECHVARMATKIDSSIKSIFEDKSIHATFPIQKEMILILDELGLSEDNQYIGTTEKLRRVQALLQARIATRVQLVLVGTGVDVITSNVNTNIEAVKVKVKPWGIQDIQELAKSLGLKDEDKNVLEEPTMVSLGSNARAACFMIKELKRYAPIYTAQAALVEKVVIEVAYRYMNSNGLAKCNSMERRHVAKVVLDTLRRTEKSSTSNPADTSKNPINMIECSNSKVRRVAVGLMDFHIETENSKFKLSTGQGFAVTVSPAVTIVLSALMGAIGTFSASWKAVERIGALDALGELVCNSTLPIPAMSVVRANCPFPASGGTINYKAPIVPRNMVLLNGKGAQHADVISHYRFGQFKKSSGDRADLNIQEELAKMGLLEIAWYENNDNKYLPNRWMTRDLILQWEGTSQPSGFDFYELDLEDKWLYKTPVPLQSAVSER